MPTSFSFRIIGLRRDRGIAWHHRGARMFGARTRPGQGSSSQTSVLDWADPVSGAPAMNRLFEDLRGRVGEALANSPVKDVERNVKAMVSNAAGRLDLVTREEFEIQAKVLARTRELVTQLEARVAALEALLEKRDTAA